MRFVAIAFSCVLAACGGGGSSDLPGQQAKQPSSSCVRPVLIQLFGDSTQEQQFNSVQLQLDLILGPGVARVENHGLSNTTAADFPVGKVVRGAISVVNYGINDIRTPGMTVELYKAQLRKISPSYFQTPNPPIDGYAQAMREVAAELGKPVIDVSAKVRAMPNWRNYFYDGVHPGAPMYPIITRDIVAPELADAVRRAACLG